MKKYMCFLYFLYKKRTEKLAIKTNCDKRTNFTYKKGTTNFCGIQDSTLINVRLCGTWDC